jgi:peptide/nickel transport system permease protein
LPTFIFRRLLTMIPLLIGISILVFTLMNMAPGNALDEYRARPDIPPELIHQLEIQYGYKDAHGNPNPGYVRYFYWVNSVSPVKFINPGGEFTWRLRFGWPSLGDSFEYRVPVTDLLEQRVPATLLLEITALVFAWGVAIPLGVMAAVKKDSWADRLSSLLAYSALSIPEYFLGILLIIPAAKTGLFPIFGRAAFNSEFLPPGAKFLDYAWHLILPAFVLGVGGIAMMMRVMRVSMLDYLRAEFVTTARAKGVPEGRIMFVHVMRNAINPLITTFGFAFANLLSGALLVEYAMSYPGLGRLVYDAFTRHDEYLVMAAMLVSCIMLVFGNLIADILLALSDPRIRLEQQSTGLTAGRRGAGWATVIALICAVILAADVHLLPTDNPEALGRIIGQIKVPVMMVLMAVGLMLTYLSRSILWKLLKSLRRQPLTAFAVICLLLLYAGAFFAPSLSTQPIGQINLKNTFHPPSRLVWRDGHFWAQTYKNVDPTVAHYEPDPGVLIPLTFFGHASGYSYNLLGFFLSDAEADELASPTQPPGWLENILSVFETDRHLFAVDYDALTAQVGHAPDLKDYPFYLLGSDSTGRDVYSRLLYGSRISLTIGLVGIAITLVMGFLVGGLSGYFGGSFDFCAMRLVEFLLSMPTLYLLLALRATLAPYFASADMYMVIIVILSLIGWAGTARVLRGMSLSLRERPFINAAECLGQSPMKIMFRHFLPNLSGYLLVSAMLSIPGYILGEAALSFLGLGIQDPSASWGLMLKQSQDMKVLMLDFWWLLLPGVAIFITVVSFNLVGDALRDIVDPKMKTR